MANHRNRFPGRRRFLKQSTALTATVVALPLPRLTGAQQPAPTEEKKTGDDARPATSTVRAPAQRRRGHKQ